MPFLNLNTNLSKDKITAETMNQLAQEMSGILGKDTKWINWMLSTDKLMSRVSFSSYTSLGCKTVIKMLREISPNLLADPEQRGQPLHLAGDPVHRLVRREGELPRPRPQNPRRSHQADRRAQGEHSPFAEVGGEARVCHERSLPWLKDG